MMIGPMKKKVITSSVVTAIILILVFTAIAFFVISSKDKQIAELKKKSEVVQRYVFARNMTKGDVVSANDVLLIDVKNESAAEDSYTNLYAMIGRRLKVNANSKTIVTESLFFEEDGEPELDTRMQEFNMITLPSDLEVGDYIDVRIRFATGEDFSVLVGKKIYDFGALESESNTIFLKLSEEEILRMGSAIIESYIRDGVHLYANKYVDPDAQLFTYNRVNYVQKFEDARFVIADENSESGEEIVKTERSVSEIASIIGLSVEDTKTLKNAIDTRDEDTLNFYKDKLVVGSKSVEKTYPVKTEVATLIQSNPNIITEIRSKYNVEKLEQQRINFLDTNLTKVDEYTGEIVTNDDYINNIKTKLDTEIETQRTERQEYLLNLLAKQASASEK